MRRLAAGALLALLLTGMAVGQERTTVFRDLAWGDPPSALGPNAVYVRTYDDVDFYVRTDEDYQIGSIRADSITYGFFQDKLWGITIKVRDISATERMLKARFGQPDRSNRFMVDMMWFEKDTWVSFEEILGEKAAYWHMFSVEIAEEQRRWQEEQAAKDAAAF